MRPFEGTLGGKRERSLCAVKSTSAPPSASINLNNYLLCEEGKPSNEMKSFGHFIPCFIEELHSRVEGEILKCVPDLYWHGYTLKDTEENTFRNLRIRPLFSKLLPFCDSQTNTSISISSTLAWLCLCFISTSDSLKTAFYSSLLSRCKSSTPTKCDSRASQKERFLSISHICPHPRKRIFPASSTDYPCLAAHIIAPPTTKTETKTILL
jgi:hypothetical protein